ncbi:MAG: cphA [Candidatus Saccharibacteria bacterium]|nr:cphA [Candidatus Saccharibacteria bacterium]
MMNNSVTRTLIIAEALRRGWRTEGVGPNEHFLRILHPDGRKELLWGTMSTRTTAIGNMICRYKNLTLSFVQDCGYGVPAFKIVPDEQTALDFLEQHKKIVLKPADGQRTEGVSVGITDAAVIPKAFAYAQQNSSKKSVIAQQHLEGNLYRIVVLDGKLVAAAWRTAAAVVGDGQSTVDELIAQANLDPRRGKGTDTPLKTIDITAAEEFLGHDCMQSIPAVSDRIIVSPIDSISAGGEAVNVTNDVHDDWRRFAEHVATEAGLFICGYDVICEDIAKPLSDSYVPLLEINSSPGMKLHEYPTGGGEPIHLAPLLLDALFPSEKH